MAPGSECYGPGQSALLQVSHKHHHKSHHHHKSRGDGDEKAAETEENATESLPELKYCKTGGKGVPGVDCRRDTRKNCKKNTVPEDYNPSLGKEMKCKILPTCHDTPGGEPGSTCYQTKKALNMITTTLTQKRSRGDGDEKATATEEDDTEKTEELKYCKKGGAGVPGVDCRKDTRPICKNNKVPESFDETLGKEMTCRANVITCDKAPGMAAGSECYAPGQSALAQKHSSKHHHHHHKHNHDSQLAPNLPKCDGGNGVLGVDCVSVGGYPKKLDEPIPIGGLV